MSATLTIAPGEAHCDFVDRLPRELRALVHEYGLNIVMAFYNSGVRSPSSIRHLISTARHGAREPGNKRHYASRLSHLDAFLVASGSSLTARQIVRVIREGNYTVLPISGPTLEMTQASMATVTNGSVHVEKQARHQMRLQAAMTAGDRALWGDF